MFAEHNDYTKPKLEGSSHLFPLFALSLDEAQGGKNWLSRTYILQHALQS